MRAGMRFDPDAFYESICRDGLTHLPHFACRATYHQMVLVYERTLAHIKAPCRALDWGCGEGHFSHFLTSFGIETVGYSFGDCPPHLAGRSSFTHARGSEADPVSLPFRDGAFDAVFSIGVLEHVHETGGDEVASAKEIHRILRPGGLFLCFHFPNQGSWIEKTARAIGYDAYTHPRRYTRTDIARIVSASGFRLIEQGRYGFFPRNILSRAPRRLANARSAAAALDRLDAGLGAVLPGVCQNHYFIAERAG